MLYARTDALCVAGDSHDVACAQRVLGEVVSGMDGYENGWGRGEADLAEEIVVDLFCGADFHCSHHFAGGDDDATEDLRGRRHGCWT